MKQYFFNLGNAISQLINVGLFMGGNANESISGRCWRQRSHWFFGRLRTTIDYVALLMGDEDHCWNSYCNEISNAMALLKEAELSDHVQPIKP